MEGLQENLINFAKTIDVNFEELDADESELLLKNMLCCEI